MQSAIARNEIAYVTSKVFPDGSNEIRIKRNIEITPIVIAKAQRSKALNKQKRELRKKALINQFSKIPFTASDYERKKRLLEFKLNTRNLDNVFRSARRARQNLYDICRCNDFEYFVTWTFSPDKVERLNDNIVKRKFTQFQNYLRKMFPNMYYIAVPEYHDKGELHFHLLVGGATMEELKAVPARYAKRKGKHKKGDLIFKRGKQIFNVERWTLGYSTLSVIENAEATKQYVCKYISKQNLDPRFFGKKRYYVSKNIRRPDISKWSADIEHCLDGIDLNVYLVAYGDHYRKRYAVLTSDGNGVVNTELNTAEVKKHMAMLATNEYKQSKTLSRAEPEKACAYGAARDSAYLTIRTHDRNDASEVDWKYLKNKIQRAYFRTLRNFRPPHEDYDCMKCEEQAILDEYYANMAVKSCEKMGNPEAYCQDIGLFD